MITYLLIYAYVTLVLVIFITLLDIYTAKETGIYLGTIGTIVLSMLWPALIPALMLFALYYWLDKELKKDNTK